MAVFELLERDNYPGAFDIRYVSGDQTPAEVRLFDGIRRLLSEVDEAHGAGTSVPTAGRLRQIAMGGLVAPAHQADAWLPDLIMFELEFHGRPPVVQSSRNIRKGKYFGAYLSEPNEGPANITYFRISASDPPPSSYHDLLARYEDIRSGLLTMLDSVNAKTNDPSWRQWFRTRRNRGTQVRDRLHRYVRQLVFAVFGGLEQDDVDTATKQLKYLEGEIVSREANWVKNGYMGRLGFISFLAAATFSAVYGCIRLFHLGEDETWVIWRFREFLLLGAGCAIGSWLSFAIRHPRLDSVRDLAVMELDQLNPANRVLFAVCLSCVVGLILQSGMIEISINGFRSVFQYNGVRAILLGLVCGISEIAIRDVVRGRSDDIVQRLAVQSTGK